MSLLRKTLSVTCFALCSINYLHAQLYKVDIDEKVQYASLIIEGKVIAQHSFWNEKHTMIFTSNTIELYKIFKGNAADTTIEILTQGGAVGTTAVEASDLLQLNKNKTGIFFCLLNKSGIKSPLSKKILYDVYGSDQGFLRYDIRNDIASAPFALYKNIKGNLYNLIQQKTGLSYRVVKEFSTSNTIHINNGVHAGSADNGGEGVAITSFSPATIHGGALNDAAASTLTINGSGFGTASGQAAVLFKDGNSDNSQPDFEVPYNSSYIVSWTDTRIVVKVPSRAATGLIAVVNASGTSANSPSELNIFYSVLNFTFDFSSLGIDTIVSAEPRLMDANGSGGYSVKYGTNTAGGGKDFNASPTKGTFQRALKTWKDLVGVNFIEAGTTNVQVIADDKINVIQFDNNNTGVPPMAAGVLETTYSWGSACYFDNPFQILTAQKTGFDVLIRNDGVSAGNIAFADGPCFPQPAGGGYETDREMVVLHELGHALNLTHINDDFETIQGQNLVGNTNPSKVMHYSVLNYINRRSLDNAAYLGGTYAVARQNNTYGNCGLFTNEMTLLPVTVAANDECPSSFPSTPTPDGSIVAFDLAHTTSNKFTDPQFTAISCNQANGLEVTNNAYFAYRSGSSDFLNINISGYATTPVELLSCSGQSVRLAVYDVSACPAGQTYPQPIVCRTFSGNGAIPSITGLQQDHNYLLYFDGILNTKASFNAAINSDGIIVVAEKKLKLYPNPVHDKITISITDSVSGKYQFALYDVLGRLLLSQSYTISPGTQTTTLNMLSFARGVYFLRIADAAGNIIRKEKIMKGF